MELDAKFSCKQWSKQLHTVLDCLSNSSFKVADDSILHLLHDKIKLIGYCETNLNFPQAYNALLVEQLLRQRQVVNVLSEELIQISKIEWFIISVLEKRTSLNGAVVSFAVKLIGWLGETEDSFTSFKNTVEKSFSKVLQDTQDFTILTAAFDSLSKISGHALGLKWILTGPADYIEKSFNLLSSGSSVFVDRAILNFLVSSWVNSTYWCKESSIFEDFCESSLKHVSQTLETATAKRQKSGIQNTSNTRETRLVPIMQLVEEVCNKSDSLTRKIMNSPQLYETISELVMTGNKMEGRVAMNILKIFIEKSSDSSLIKKLESFTATLYIGGNIQKAQELTLCFLKKKHEAPSLVSSLWEPLKRAIAESNGQMLKKSQSEYLDVLCHTIVCLGKTDLNAMPDILKLFKMTSESCSAQQTVGYLKLQKTCLNYFLHIIESGKLNHSVTIDMVSCLLEVVRNISVDHQIYSSCLKCLLPLLGSLLVSAEQHEDKPETQVAELSDVIQRHLCAIQWEMRDTTLEFLSQILGKYKDNPAIMDWFTTKHLHLHTWQCVSDSDSYVRATAITCISNTVSVPEVWKDLVTPRELTERDLVTRILNIVKTDTEAFPRRTAVRFLHSYYNQKIEVTDQFGANFVRETLMTSSKDFDWEVKLAGLDFIQTLILQATDELSKDDEDSIPSYAVDLIKRHRLDNSEEQNSKIICVLCKLHLYGCWNSLFMAVEDYDQTVLERADKILSNFSSSLKDVIGARICGNKLKEFGAIVDKQLKESEGHRTKMSNSEKVMSSSVVLQALNRTEYSNQSALQNGEAMSPKCNSKTCTLISDDKMDLKEEILNLIEKLSNYEAITQSSGDNGYETNPFSLLEDILLYAQKDEESNVVDCY